MDGFGLLTCGGSARLLFSGEIPAPSYTSGDSTSRLIDELGIHVVLKFRCTEEPEREAASSENMLCVACPTFGVNVRPFSLPTGVHSLNRPVRSMMSNWERRYDSSLLYITPSLTLYCTVLDA